MNKKMEKAIKHFEEQGCDVFTSNKKTSNIIAVGDNKKLLTVKCRRSSPVALDHIGESKSYKTTVNECDLTFVDCGIESFVIDNAKRGNRKVMRFGIDSKRNNGMIRKV